MNDSKIMSRLKEHLAEALVSAGNPDWFVICLQGSQNYDMADENSDIDSKLLIIPELEDLVLNITPPNHVHIMDNNEHCDVKDIRDYFKIVRKQNINFVEIFFTDYYLVNSKYKDVWMELQRHREEIANGNIYSFLKCCKGMIFEKQHALTHPYPSKLDLLEKYGFDGKQLSHAYRVYDFATRFVSGKESYKDCLVPKNKDFLMSIKRNEYPEDVETAKYMMDEIVEKITLFEAMNNKYRTNKFDENVSKLLDDSLYNIITRSIKEELK